MSKDIISKKKHTRQEHLLGVTLLLAFLLPHTSTWLQIVNPILCLLLVFTFRHRLVLNYKWLVIFPVVFSLLLNIQFASQKALLSTVSILLYFWLFPIVCKVAVRNAYLYICLGFIFFSQMIYLLDIPFLINFFDLAYPISEDDINYVEHIRNNISYDNLFDYRLGGLYHNPNQCSRFLSMLLAFFLCVNVNNKSKGIILFAAFAYIGILVTGSRTGFIIASLILYLGLLRQKRYSRRTRYIFYMIAFGGLIYILNSGSALRGFDIEGGLQGSTNMKWETFTYYIENETNVFSLLLGHIDTSLFSGQFGLAMDTFDSEYGEIIYRFGFIGFLCFMVFWYKSYRRVDKEAKFFFLTLLWGITSTIVTSYRTLFIYILLLSVIIANSKRKSLTNNI